MKVSSKHLEAMRNVIAPLDTSSARAAYLRREIPGAALVRDLDKRYRWDLFYAAKCWREIGESDYLDTHLDTALRAIVPPL